MKTQYDELVSSDLVVLDIKPLDVSDVTHRSIMKADWYEINGIILIDPVTIDCATETDPLDAGIDLSEIKVINRVADALKRFDGDNYYHV